MTSSDVGGREPLVTATLRRRLNAVNSFLSCLANQEELDSWRGFSAFDCTGRLQYRRVSRKFTGA